MGFILSHDAGNSNNCKNINIEKKKNNLTFQNSLFQAAETVSQAKDFTRDFEPKDFELVVECELRSFSKSEDPWNFKHYAPIVFHRLRQLFHVVPEEYMVFLIQIFFFSKVFNISIISLV